MYPVILLEEKRWTHIFSPLNPRPAQSSPAVDCVLEQFFLPTYNKIYLSNFIQMSIHRAPMSPL
jgi:hypothetical protein